MAASDHDIPVALVAHCHDMAVANDVGYIQVFLRASKYPTTVVGPAQPWDGNAYALVGDIVGDQFTIAPFPAANFNLAPQGTWVPTDAAMTTAIAADADGLLAPIAPNAANSEEVRTRLATWVPFSYVPLLLAEALRPKQAFQRVLGAAQTANQVPAVRPLLDFLKVASVGIVGAPDHSAVVAPWPRLPQPPNAALITFFSRKISRDLPNCQAGGPPDPRQFHPVIAAIDSLTAEQRQQRLDAQARQAASDRGKTPTQFYGDQGVVKLMRLAQVFHETQLPPLWARLASTPKTARLTAVQSAIDEQRAALNVYFDIPVSVAFVTKLVNLNFAGANQDDLSQGINPFLFGLATPQQREQLEHRAALYRHIHGGTATPSLADTLVLEAPDDVKLATTMQALQHSIDATRAVLSALLGQVHTATTWANDARRALDTCAGDLAVQAAYHPTLPADIQRYMQIELIHWFRQQECSHAPVAFTAHNIVYEAAKGAMYWRYPLPQSVLPNAPTPAPTLHPPSVTPPVLPPGPEGPPRPGQNSIVRNPKYDKRFAQIRDRPNVRSRDVKTRCAANNVTLPIGDDGAPRCLPYHIKGQCNDNCGSAADHHDRHTDAAQDRLVTWATEHWKTE